MREAQKVPNLHATSNSLGGNIFNFLGLLAKSTTFQAFLGHVLIVFIVRHSAYNRKWKRMQLSIPRVHARQHFAKTSKPVFFNFHFSHDNGFYVIVAKGRGTNIFERFCRHKFWRSRKDDNAHAEAIAQLLCLDSETALSLQNHDQMRNGGQNLKF